MTPTNPDEAVVEQTFSGSSEFLSQFGIPIQGSPYDVGEDGVRLVHFGELRNFIDSSQDIDVASAALATQVIRRSVEVYLENLLGYDIVLDESIPGSSSLVNGIRLEQSVDGGSSRIIVARPCGRIDSGITFRIHNGFSF